MLKDTRSPSAAAAQAPSPTAEERSVPQAAKHPVAHTVHGRRRVDPYDWLRASNWQEVMRQPETLDAEIRGFLEAENAHLEAGMADTADLQETLFAEMKGRIKEDDSTVPSPDGPFAYGVS